MSSSSSTSSTNRRPAASGPALSRVRQVGPGRVVPFRRVARVAKQIVKARKPQSCALFSFQILRFCSRYPAFCSCVPVLCSRGLHSAPVSLYSAPVAGHSTSSGPAFCLWCPTILLPVASHSTSRFPAILPPRPRTLLPQHILSPQRVTLPFAILLFSSQRSVLRYQSPLLPHPGQHPM